MSPVFPLEIPLERPIRLAVLLSGGGSTLANLLKHIQSGALKAEIPLVISSRANCKGVERARDAGLACEVISRKDFLNVHDFSDAIFAACRAADVDLVILAGFLSLIEVPADFRLRVLNIHPGLIPGYCGKGFYGEVVHSAVLARGAKISGCTVHFADNEYDHGPIIAQKAVPVYDDDTPATLAARVFEAECVLYPEVIQSLADAAIDVVGHQVRRRRPREALSSETPMSIPPSRRETP